MKTSRQKMRACSALVAIAAAVLATPTARADRSDLWRTAFEVAGATAVGGITRTPIDGDLVEYSAILRVGPGAFDRIGIHRVVRERRPWVPIAAPRGVVLVHGSASTFRTAFAPGLVSSAIDPDAGLAPFLAEAGIDVWGIDLRWSLVPAGQTSFEFMRDWNLGMHVGDVQKVATIARILRGLGGSGFGKLFFSGHSLGATVVYAYANEDTQRHPWARDVRGIVPIEINYRLVSEESQFLRDEAAIRYQAFRAAYDSGVYASDTALQLQQLIALGLAQPSGPSPIVPGFTNLETATAVFSLTHLFYAPLPAYTPWYHFLAGTFDPTSGAPTGFHFAEQIPTLELGLTFPPYQSMIEGVEIDALISGAVDLPYDDHLGEITAPALYIGAAGGFGAFGSETLGLLGSTDTSSRIVRLQPEGAEAIDFGHADVLFASNAEALVWEPMLDWLVAH